MSISHLITVGLACQTSLARYATKKTVVADEADIHMHACETAFARARMGVLLCPDEGFEPTNQITKMQKKSHLIAPHRKHHTAHVWTRSLVVQPCSSEHATTARQIFFFGLRVEDDRKAGDSKHPVVEGHWSRGSPQSLRLRLLNDLESPSPANSSPPMESRHTDGPGQSQRCLALTRNEAEQAFCVFLVCKSSPLACRHPRYPSKPNAPDCLRDVTFFEMARLEGCSR